MAANVAAIADSRALFPPGLAAVNSYIVLENVELNYIKFTDLLLY